MTPRLFFAKTLVVALLAGCGPGGGTTGTGGAGGAGGAGGSGAGAPAAAEDWNRDVLETGLTLDLAALGGKAVVTLATAESEAASFEIGDLEIASVSDAGGALLFETVDGPHGKALNVGVRPGANPEITIEYTFQAHDAFDGWMPDTGVSFLWPYFCGNLFPCKSDPADGSKFTMEILGVPAAATAVFPAEIPGDAPTYMPAVAVGEYTEIDLGTTAAGTQIRAYHLPGEAADMTAGTVHLTEVFDFFETTYGPYPFGNAAGAVSAPWGPGAFGGMEHHPFWHVATDSLASEEVQAHEAAHGWFGNGVRIACWEDFVLSEGTVTYLAARSLAEFGVDVWPDYECELQYVCDPANGANTVALPDTCNAIDLLTDPLWSTAPYMKGAYFYKGVADAVGEGALDALLASFFTAHVAKAARMADMLAHLKAGVSAPEADAIDALAAAWLTDVACPVDHTMLCL